MTTGSGVIRRLSWDLGIATTRLKKLARVACSRELFSALCRGTFASVEHEEANLAPMYGSVIDIGASRGQFAIFALHKWPSAAVMCFEPLPGPAAQLRRLLGDRVKLHEVALGARRTTRPMNLSGRDDSSSFLEIARQAMEYPGTEAVGNLLVEVETLSEHLGSELERPTLLKIDVQGYELEVLRGAGDSINYVDEILCECSFVELYGGQPLAADVIAYLAEQGFRLASVSGTSRRRGVALQADLLFKRAST
jgi:FkbM family methyltransferase